MTAAVAALFADGPSTLRNIGSWRVKETDRIAAMATELRKFGAAVEEGADCPHHAAGKVRHCAVWFSPRPESGRGGVCGSCFSPTACHIS